MLVLCLIPAVLRGEGPSPATSVPGCDLVYHGNRLEHPWRICRAEGRSNGHAMFYAVGAYISALMLKWWHITPWLSMFVAAAVCAVLAFILGYPLLRLRGHYFAISTMAIVECVRIIFTNWNLIGGATGVSYFEKSMSPWYTLQFTNRVPYYYILLVFLLIFVCISRVIERTKFGYYLRAIKANQDSAESAGVNSTVYKRRAYMISAAIVGIAGALYAQYIQYIDLCPCFLFPTPC